MTDKIIVPTGNPRYRLEFFNLFVQNGWKISVNVFVVKSKAIQFAENFFYFGMTCTNECFQHFVFLVLIT